MNQSKPSSEQPGKTASIADPSVVNVGSSSHAPAAPPANAKPSVANWRSVWSPILLFRHNPIAALSFWSCVLGIAVLIVLMATRKVGGLVPPGMFIAILGLLATALTVFPMPIQSSGLGDFTPSQTVFANAFIRVQKALAVGLSFLLVVCELWSISADRKQSEAKLDSQIASTRLQLDTAQVQMTTAQHQIMLTTRQTIMGYSSLGAFAVLLREQSVHNESDALPDGLKKRALSLVSEMMLTEASHILNQPYNQADRSHLATYREQTANLFAQLYNDRFQKMSHEIVRALRQQHRAVQLDIRHFTKPAREWGPDDGEDIKLTILARYLSPSAEQ